VDRRRHRNGGNAALAVGLLLLGGCGSSGSTGDNPRSALQGAARATAEARSFEVELRQGTVTIVYQAPDRFRMVEQRATHHSRAPGSVDDPPSSPSTIVNVFIGRTHYRAGPSARAESFTRRNVEPNEATPADLLGVLRSVANAHDVRLEGGVYRFRVASAFVRPGAPVVAAVGEAKLAGGYLRTLLIRYDESTRLFPLDLDFRDINRAPRVQAPPADAVEPSSRPVP
jgi:hypothetical protein